MVLVFRCDLYIGRRRMLGAAFLNAFYDQVNIEIDFSLCARLRVVDIPDVVKVAGLLFKALPVTLGGQ